MTYRLPSLLPVTPYDVPFQVFGCLSALVDTDPAIEVRRAAVLLVSQLIAGLGADALKVRVRCVACDGDVG